jgi:hypothetical protein
VAVYGHNFSDGFGQKVRAWASARGTKLVSIGYRNAWADSQWITAGPRSFALCMAEAEAVATPKPFVVELSSYRSNKLKGLAESLQIDDRLVSAATPSSDYRRCLETPVQLRVLNRIDHLRKTSEEFLNEAHI